MAEINTRIILRNDTADAWGTEAGAATPLKKGEAAVEIKDGKARVKVAIEDNKTFEKFWCHLPDYLAEDWREEKGKYS